MTTRTTRNPAIFTAMTSLRVEPEGGATYKSEKE